MIISVPPYKNEHSSDKNGNNELGLKTIENINEYMN